MLIALGPPLTRLRLAAVPTLLAVLAACASGSEGKLSPTATPAPVAQTLVRYGDDASQVADLLVPSGGAELPVVVLIHGGFWQEPFKRDLMDGLARDLADRGFATLNLEYRRVGASEGGWPETALDVAAAAGLADTASANWSPRTTNTLPPVSAPTWVATSAAVA